MAGHALAVTQAIAILFDVVAKRQYGSVVLNSMLADGTDQIAARAALAMGWRLTATLPFGPALTCAIGACTDSHNSETRLATLNECAGVNALAINTTNPKIHDFFELARHSQLDALAEFDRQFSDSWIAAGDDPSEQQLFETTASERFALAAANALSTSHVLVAVWDGASTARVGGTGHTIEQALKRGLPVLRIDPAAPHLVHPLLSNNATKTTPATPHEAVDAALGRIGNS